MRLGCAFWMCLGLLACSLPARADVTVFTGSATSSSNRLTTGTAVGITLLAVGFEFEYATIKADTLQGAPNVRTGMANAFLQPPMAILGIHPYATTGVGFYRERSTTASQTGFGLNYGAGVKIALIGPLRARLDYRVFKLRGTPQRSVIHRLYVGANLAF
jgi:opacity protein-like surface antigen